jgi:HemY protein
MTRTLLYLVLFAVLAAGAVWLADNPGEVVINWQGYVIELSVVWLAIIAVFTVFLTIGITEIWRWLRKGIREQRRLARYQRSFDELGWGLGALIANDGDKARRHAENFARLSENDPLSHIMIGQAALLQDDTNAARMHFSLLEDDSRTRPIALRGLLTIADAEGDAEAAYDVAQKAQQSAPKATWSQRPFVEAAVELGRWDGAAKALRAAIAQGHLDKAEGARMQAVVALARARQVRADNADEARRHVREALKLDPGLTPASVLAADLAHEKKRDRRAQKFLRDGWTHAPHPDLATAFVDLRTGDGSAADYKRVGTLVSQGPTHPDGLYAQARYALAAGLTGPARGHLNAMRDLMPQTRTYQMLADVEARAGNTDAQQIARDRIATALPDPVWHCTACGQEHVDWQPVCTDCGDFATIRWAPIERKIPVLVEDQPDPVEDTQDNAAILLTSDAGEQPEET